MFSPGCKLTTEPVKKYRKQNTHYANIRMDASDEVQLITRQTYVPRGQERTTQTIALHVLFLTLPPAHNQFDFAWFRLSEQSGVSATVEYLF